LAIDSSGAHINDPVTARRADDSWMLVVIVTARQAWALPGRPIQPVDLAASEAVRVIIVGIGRAPTLLKALAHRALTHPGLAHLADHPGLAPRVAGCATRVTFSQVD
jgi:hypothetical protein